MINELKTKILVISLHFCEYIVTSVVARGAEGTVRSVRQ